MLIPALQALAGLVLLFFGGEALVRGAVAIAHKFGMSALSIGLTIVAFATSAPELAVSVSAALDGAPEIALGNVIGSNVANIGLILAAAALIHPLVVESKLLKIDAWILLASVILMCLLLANSHISRIEGALLAIGLVAYVAFTLWDARRFPAPSVEDIEVTGTAIAKPIGFHLMVFLAGLVMLVLGGKLLVLGAVAIATALDISQAVIGLTVIAIGTSLPELAATLVAALRGYGSMAIGNIVGSNIFNTFGILGITATVEPLTASAIGWTDLGTMAGFSALMVLFLHTSNLLERREGAVLFGGYVIYTAWLVVA